jgi:HTH-type transcriptional regulator, quorum sensing regulator NprR
VVIGEKIYYYRVKKGLTQNDLSKGICSISYLSKIENNSIQSNPEVIQLLCERLEINYEDNNTIINELKSNLFELYNAIKERNLESASELFESVTKRINLVDDPSIISLHNLMSARYWMFQREFTKALSFLDKLTAIRKNFSDDLNYYYHSFYGLYHYLNGDLKISLKYFLTAQEISEIIQKEEPEFIYQLAILYSRLGNNSMSIIKSYKAMAIFNKNANYERSVDCLILLGISYNRVKDEKSGESYLLKALKASKYLSNQKYIQSIIYHNLGFVYSSKKEHVKAIEYYKKSTEYNKNLHSETCYLLANEYYKLGDSKGAHYWINQGLDLIGNKEVDHKYKLEILKLQLEEKEESLDYEEQLQLAVVYFDKKKDLINLKKCYEKLGQYYSKKFLYKDSSFYYSKAIHLYH